MGWFSSSSPKDPEVSSRQDRRKCWEARDTYFSCLDRAGVVKAGEEGAACSAELRQYEQNCAKSWVCVSHPFHQMTKLLSRIGRFSISTSGG